MLGIKAGKLRNTIEPSIAHRTPIYIERTMGYLVALMLLRSSFAHLANPYSYLDSIFAYNLTNYSISILIALAFPFIQVTISLCLLTRQYVPAAWSCAIALFMTFFGAQSLVLAHGDTISCGCFGQGETVQVGGRSLALAASGLAVSVIGFMLTWRGTRGALQFASVPQRAGLSLVEVLVAISIIGLLIGLLLPAVQKSREAAARAKCQSNLRQSVLALHMLHDSLKTLPPGLSVKAEAGKYPYLGWTARILPWVEQAALWDEIEWAIRVNPDRTYDPPHGAIVRTPVPIFTCPSDGRLPGPNPVGRLLHTHTSYLGVEGLDQYTFTGSLYLDSEVRMLDVTDGLSQTLIIGERPPSTDFNFGWWYRANGQNDTGSGDMVLGVREINTYERKCEKGPYHFQAGNFNNQCDAFHFWSPHPGGANFAFADGSVRLLTYVADSILPELASRAGGEAVSLPE